MGQWKGWIKAEEQDLEMTATVHYQLPQNGAFGQITMKGKWYGTGFSEKSWGSWPYRNMVTTDIGRITIIQQEKDPNGLFIVKFEGYDAPKGLLLAEIERQK